MTETLLALLGLLAAIVAVGWLVRWAIGLANAYSDGRLAEDDPHRRRTRNLRRFVLLFALSAGPWVLAAAVFGAFRLFTVRSRPWDLWVICGSVAYFAMIACLVTLTSMAARKKGRSLGRGTGR